MAARHFGDMLVDPLALAFELFRTVAAGLHLDVETHNLGKRRPRLCQGFGQMENFAVALVADDQMLLGVEHREAASHVVERDLKPSVELLKILFEPFPWRAAWNAFRLRPRSTLRAMSPLGLVGSLFCVSDFSMEAVGSFFTTRLLRAKTKTNDSKRG